jgi:hypothetical protein
MHSAILETILALSTTDPQISHVAFDRGADSAHVFAYDSENQLAAEIVLWVEPDERYIHVDANFSDGVYLAGTYDGERVVAIDNENPDVTAARLAIPTAVVALCECLPEFIELAGGKAGWECF